MSLLFGLRGRTGDKGDNGDQGDKGDKGDKGDQGEAGVAPFTSRGDVVGYDYDEDTLTTDGTWYDMDLSGVVGIGKRLVFLYVFLRHASAQQQFSFRTKGETDASNRHVIWTQEANKYISTLMSIYTDDSGVIQYTGQSGTWNKIEIKVRGWFVV